MINQYLANADTMLGWDPALHQFIIYSDRAHPVPPVPPSANADEILGWATPGDRPILTWGGRTYAFTETAPSDRALVTKEVSVVGGGKSYLIEERRRIWAVDVETGEQVVIVLPN